MISQYNFLPSVSLVSSKNCPDSSLCFLFILSHFLNKKILFLQKTVIFCQKTFATRLVKCLRKKRSKTENASFGGQESGTIREHGICILKNPSNSTLLHARVKYKIHTRAQYCSVSIKCRKKEDTQKFRIPADF